VRFYRQYVIGPFIADFVCLSARLIVEVDSPIHIETSERDRARDEWLANAGYRILRISSSDVEHDLASVLESIRLQLIDKS
ncbi:MAG: hypothetical protein RL199_1057, partial [Pseudomonadota bacterium]